MIVNNTCTDCGSNRGGSFCQCGNMRCCCDPKPCEICEDQIQREQDEERRNYESEQQEREQFEEDMDRKYHN